MNGENFITIEGTKNLAENEMIEFAHHFMDDLAIENVPSMNVLVSSKFSNYVDRLLEIWRSAATDQMKPRCMHVTKVAGDFSDPAPVIFHACQGAHI
ncbi:hypothetical protein [Lentibacillus sp. CBA3610]|uniref:hypothetical protein n=1 Tax=Lentibacillus sp. CBA3610 TaxID=2518176 RepID=UPI001595A626|nr:hypothetical protein [Lentibacillus sp. CBA3610]QKY70645.1 hypothetical protein Len3610_14545 [Lentibacillus sp. CBA3610]